MNPFRLLGRGGRSHGAVRIIGAGDLVVALSAPPRGGCVSGRPAGVEKRRRGGCVTPVRSRDYIEGRGSSRTGHGGEFRYARAANTPPHRPYHQFTARKHSVPTGQASRRDVEMLTFRELADLSNLAPNRPPGRFYERLLRARSTRA